MECKMDLRTAIEIAKAAESDGLEKAVEMIGMLGYEIWPYWNIMEDMSQDDYDYDEVATQCYEDLLVYNGLKDIMKEAYKYIV